MKTGDIIYQRILQQLDVKDAVCQPAMHKAGGGGWSGVEIIRDREKRLSQFMHAAVEAQHPTI